MTYLPDVNVWIAVAYDAHVHHAPATAWFEAIEADKIVFCRVTELAFLRLLTNPRVMTDKDVRTYSEAWTGLDTLYKDTSVGFAEEPEGLERAWRNNTHHHNTGANFWTDAYLAGFAAAAGYTIVTFNRGFRRYKDVRLELLGAQ